VWLLYYGNGKPYVVKKMQTDLPFYCKKPSPISVGSTTLFSSLGKIERKKQTANPYRTANSVVTTL
jgi:hypothetical protein